MPISEITLMFLTSQNSNKGKSHVFLRLDGPPLIAPKVYRWMEVDALGAKATIAPDDVGQKK